ncbi:arrestin domain-containing protein 3-like [Eucyclogobius newberryi]|uniref:arrestin domain-containing protein 3-like n=1 Tax=Eucyclogobius newberryi TaxID=166745 RepID=UPI003B5B1CEC
MTIESFSIEYDANNTDNVFSRGDTIRGRVVLELSKETKIDRLTVKAKGKASVLWTEYYSPVHHMVYTSKEKYFTIDKNVLDSTRGSKVIAVGRHIFPFTFEIPNMHLPPSFKGEHGKITYSLEARVNRSMRLDQKTKEEFFIVSNEDPSTPDINKPQHTRSDKKLLSPGNVILNVHTKQMGYQQGDNIEVQTVIINNSNNTVTPKYYLYEKQCFFTKLKRRVYTKDLIKEPGKPVEAQTELTDTKVLHIPNLLPPTLLGCSILKLEYRLKVVLNTSLLGNEEAKLPIVVMRESKMLQEPSQSFA